MDRLAAALRPAGLTIRGGFHPERRDRVPAFADGTPAGTVVMIGNAGPAMWQAFSAAGPDVGADHPLDGWLEPLLRAAAAAVGAEPVFPKDGPPYPPFPQWAQRAEPVHVSPLGILIHPEYGLWHAYRAAFLFTETLALPPADTRPSPCLSCADKPCLGACPVAAFGADGFDAAACAGHIEAPAGRDCVDGGCLARRACPVGRDYLYAPPQARFHMEKFRAAMRRHLAAEGGV
ncbi:MAG: hypothetical protein QNJ94_07095 [Alphaproteobacteria bacterium]|nr:hypothetical protein [Alphaproteobacteria bacterium]